MTEPSTDGTDPAAQPDAPTTDTADTGQADTTDWKAEARKWEQRAKDNQRAAKEFEAARKAALTDSERAVLEAEERGRQAAVSTYGQRLAQTEFRAAAAARNPAYDVSKALGYLNLATFVGEDGEPDTKAIAAAVADLIPEAATGPVPPPSFDGGARTAAPQSVSMTGLIRKAAGRA
jgi:hypothetical protein